LPLNNEYPGVQLLIKMANCTEFFEIRFALGTRQPVAQRSRAAMSGKQPLFLEKNEITPSNESEKKVLLIL
jgi:hypothetical protein